MTARRTALMLIGVAALMLGAAFAAVPLYRVFCAATGYGGTTQRADEAGLIAAEAAARGEARTITVRFDSNVSPGMPWRFQPAQVTQTLHIGERGLAFFDAANLSGHATTGRAAYNVTPDTVGRYFKKIQCFCFNNQTLGAGQSAHMPVIYFIDPAILADPEAAKVKEVTLSYTFFPEPLETAKPTAAAVPPPAAPTTPTP